MIQERNIGVAIILSIITCGIYSLYWIYSLTNEISHLNGDASFTGGKVVIFGILTCGIYYLFWYYQLGAQIAKAQEQKGLEPKDDGLMYVILGIFGLGIITMAIAQSNVNQMV